MASATSYRTYSLRVNPSEKFDFEMRLRVNHLCCWFASPHMLLYQRIRADVWTVCARRMDPRVRSAWRDSCGLAHRTSPSVRHTHARAGVHTTLCGSGTGAYSRLRTRAQCGSMYNVTEASASPNACGYGCAATLPDSFHCTCAQ